MAAQPAPADPPFLPFTRPTIDEATIAGVADVLRSGWITSGPRVKELEAALSIHCGGRPVRAFNSGTCTLEIALRIAGVGTRPDDTVITSPLTWVSTANVVLEVGARPVFADIDPVTRNVDLDALEATVDATTRALIPVDLTGLPVDRDRLYAIARRHDLRVVEDAAQSFGSTWNGAAIGSIGDFVSFSFHANKNITSIEGGALVMNDEREAQLAEQYRLQGVIRTGVDGMDVERVGGKYNLTDVAARVALGQLPQVEAFTARRRALARRYFDRFDRAFLAEVDCRLPVADFTNSNWHMFQVVLPEAHLAARGERRADVITALAARGIGTGVHYPALHLFTLYRGFGWRDGMFPHAEYVGRNTLTLPLFPTMRDTDVDRVVGALEGVLKG